MIQAILKFCRSEEGPTAVEYAVMIAMIFMVCLAAVQSIGTSTNASLQKCATQLQSVAS